MDGAGAAPMSRRRPGSRPVQFEAGPSCDSAAVPINRRRCSASTPADVFGEWLGMSPVDVDQLRSDGVV